jgi:hypothetical protein
MKWIFFLLSSLSIFCSTPSVTLVWNSNPQTESITNYVVNISTNNGSLFYPINVGCNTNFSFSVYTITNWFYITAQDSSGIESLPSEIVEYVRPTEKFTVIQFNLMKSLQLNTNWIIITNYPPYICPGNISNEYFQSRGSVYITNQ